MHRTRTVRVLIICLCVALVGLVPTTAEAKRRPARHRVKQVGSLALSATVVAPGTVVTISGRVPRRTPRRAVTLQRGTGSRWVKVSRTRLTKKRRFAFKVAAPATAGEVGYRVRVRIKRRGKRRVTVVTPRVTLLVSQAGPSTWKLTAGNGGSDYTSVSADGRFIAFQSFASDLVPGDNNGRRDLFVFDRATRGTVRLTNGNQDISYPSISADGRFVAFQSAATNLVPGDLDLNNVVDVFVVDRVTTAITRVTGGNGDSSAPVLSGDGRFVALQSAATNLVAGQSDTNAKTDVFVVDRGGLLPSTRRVTSGNGHSTFPSLSRDGRFVAFESEATNLVKNLKDTNAKSDVFVADRQPTTPAISRLSNGTANTGGDGESRFPSISGDGGYVAFQSAAGNLVKGDADTNGKVDEFVVNRLASITTRLTDGNDDSSFPVISGDGRYVAFSSPASNLAPGDLNGVPDIFLIDLLTGVRQRITNGNDGSYAPSLNADGAVLAFDSKAWNLVPPDTNSHDDVFAWVR